MAIIEFTIDVGDPDIPGGLRYRMETDVADPEAALRAALQEWHDAHPDGAISLVEAIEAVDDEVLECHGLRRDTGVVDVIELSDNLFEDFLG